MKKYLFGLGAMLVGAGLMFVLMHGEVRAEEELCDEMPNFWRYKFTICEIEDKKCVIAESNDGPGVGMSCF